MSAGAVTPWFPSSAKPAHIGFYDALYDGDRATKKNIRRYYWNGQLWLRSPRDGRTSFGNSTAFKDKWRGLARKPA